jgi:hypothetical protein
VNKKVLVGILASFLVLLAAIAGVGGYLSARHTNASPAALSVTTQRVTPTLDGAAEPRAIVVGMGGNEITGITWQSWGADAATGTGQQEVSSCNPDCALGAVTDEPVTVTVAHLAGNAYTQIRETNQNGTPVNAQYGPSVSSFVESVW